MLDVRRCLNHLVRNCRFAQSDPADIARHDRMALLVEKMLALHKQLPEARTPHEKTALVCELYGLTEEEIRIVEDV